MREKIRVTNLTSSAVDVDGVGVVAGGGFTDVAGVIAKERVVQSSAVQLMLDAGTIKLGRYVDGSLELETADALDLVGAQAYESGGGGGGSTDASDLTSGTVAVARLGSSGSRLATTFLDGTNVWRVLSESDVPTLSQSKVTGLVSDLAARATLVGGYVPVAQLGSGSASAVTYLRGDGSWAEVGSLTSSGDAKVTASAVGADVTGRLSVSGAAEDGFIVKDGAGHDVIHVDGEDVLLGSSLITTNVYCFDGTNFQFASITGTKMGLDPEEKLAFWGATPVERPSGTTDLRQALIDVGLYSSGGATPLDLNGGNMTANKIRINQNLLADYGLEFGNDDNDPTWRIYGPSLLNFRYDGTVGIQFSTDFRISAQGGFTGAQALFVSNDPATPSVQCRGAESQTADLQQWQSDDEAVLAAVDEAGAITTNAQFVNTPQALVDGATVNWDANAGGIATLTLGGNRTMAAPTNLRAGAMYTLVLSQDGSGNRTVTWNAVFKWPGGSAPTLSTGANAVDIISFYCNGTNLYGVISKDFA